MTSRRSRIRRCCRHCRRQVGVIAAVVVVVWSPPTPVRLYGGTRNKHTPTYKCALYKIILYRGTRMYGYPYIGDPLYRGIPIYVPLYVKE